MPTTRRRCRKAANSNHCFRYMATYGKLWWLRRCALFTIFFSAFSTGIWLWLSTSEHVEELIPRRRSLAKLLKHDNCLETYAREPEKIILLWFVPFRDPAMVAENLFTGHIPTNLFRISWKTTACGHCRITYSRGMLNRSDAVVYHAFYPNETNRPPPKSRQDQVYVWWSQESGRTATYYDFMRSYFDWTMTPSYTSDVLSPYASFPWLLKFLWRKARGSDVMAKMAELKEVYVTAKEDVDDVVREHFDDAKQKRKKKVTSISSLQELLNKKLRLSAWIASNCRSSGSYTRLTVVDNMEENGLKIDRFGACNYNYFSISRWDPAFFEILSRYKFYLSFENSIHCNGYMTEKLWFNALYSGAVPIIWGPRRDDVKAVLPPKTYIHVEDFPSIRDLVKYIQYLDKNDTAYLEYLEWRTWVKYLDKKGEYHVENIRKLKRTERPEQRVRNLLKYYATMKPVGFCKLCLMLHARAHPSCPQAARGDWNERDECLDDYMGEEIAEKVLTVDSWRREV